MIIICCPAKVATGGTELLHQLFYELRKKSENVRMHYWDCVDNSSPIAERFEKYQVVYTNDVQDKSDNCIIVPEVYVDYLKMFTKAQRIIWWLSIDSFYANNKIKANFGSMKGKLKAYPLSIVRYWWLKNSNIIHLTQSWYAWLHLKYFKRINGFMLSDYLGDDFLSHENNYTSVGRENTVLYNPKKGMKFTREIMKCAPELNFIPLGNMTPEQIASICKKAKIYIDFGNHPGKDRLPREAAILGCVIITGKKGSANNDKDVSIPKDYKYIDRNSNINNIILKIKYIFDNYDEAIQLFDNYRTAIRNEHSVFSEQLEKLWKQHLHRYSHK
jgi:hypothetical protein